LTVTVHCAHEETRLAPALALPLFRIVQEAMTNCAKHAQAHTVEVTIQVDSPPMQIIVRDDGVGFDSAAAPRAQSGLGLMNMRETAEFVGGTLTIHSSADTGTSICVEIPEPAGESVL
jgi:signal transduction histidine kinase